MNTFTIQSGKLAIGDPTMGMVIFEFPRCGDFTLQKGALQTIDNDKKVISLDSPGVFVVDAENLNEFEKWYHKTGNEVSYALNLLAERTDEISTKLNRKVAFFWEEDLSGSPQEGQYTLNLTKITKSA